MKFSIDQQQFTTALQILQSVVPLRTPLPVIKNVRIQASEDGLFCTTTNLDIATKMKLNAEIEEHGDLIVNCKKLADLARVLPQSDIKLETVSSDRILLTSTSGSYKLIGMESDEFPKIPECEGPSFSIEGHVLARVIENTAFAASTEEVRYALNALYFNFLEDRLEVVATDGKKLALIKVDEIPSEGLTSFLLPLSGSHEIRKSFANSDSVEITIAKGRVGLSDGNTALVCRLTEAEYTNYSQIFSKKPTGHVVLNTQDLLHSVRRIAMLSSQQNHGIEFEIAEEAAQARVFAKNPEYGEGEEFLDVQESNGVIHVGLHSQYVMQVLSQISEPTVKISFTNAETPVLFEPADKADQTFLIMPMRLDHYNVVPEEEAEEAEPEETENAE